MSAFVLDKAHITALVDAGLRLSRQSGSALRWQKVTAAEKQRLIDNATSYFEIVRDLYHELDERTADSTGQMLLDACVKSVSERYPGSGNDLPGRSDREWTEPYTFPVLFNAPSPNPVVVLKAIACYEYQSCEAADWEDSEAFRFCDALRHQVISCLPGYDEAPWGIEQYPPPRPKPLSKAQVRDRLHAMDIYTR